MKFNKSIPENQPLPPRQAKILLAVSSFLILYLTLYPFDFQKEGVRPFDWTVPFWHRHHSLTDLLSNFFLFFPWGVFWRLSWPEKKLVPLGALTALLLSFGIEHLQTHLVYRSPGLPDVLMNCVGALAGLITAPLLRYFSFSWPQPASILAFFLAFYLLLEPFSFTADWGEIKENLKGLTFSFSLKNVLFPALFLAYAFRNTTLGLALASAATLEFLRILVPPLLLNPYKSALRLIGVAIFYLVLSSSSKRAPKRTLSIFGLAYLIEGLWPFSLERPEGLFRLNFIPFKLHLLNFNLETFFNTFESLFLFLFWGLLRGPLWGAVLLAGFCELIQLFVPARYPDLTAPLLAFLGAFLGRKLALRRKYDL